MAKKLYLSPSTQERNYGAGNYGTEEYRMNQLCDKVITRLKSTPNLVYYRNKRSWDLHKVVADSNIRNVNLHLALHSNACNKKERGCEVFCHTRGGEGEKFANMLYSAIAAITPTADRGVKEGFNFYGPGSHMYELAYTNAPAALIEIAFHDNKEDAEWMVANIDKIADTIANVILKYFGLKTSNPDNTGSTGVTGVYKKGSSGKDVKWIQEKINRYFTKCLLDVDGQFGPLTHESVVKFQKCRNIQVDGIVGPQTIAQLKKV